MVNKLIQQLKKVLNIVFVIKAMEIYVCLLVIFSIDTMNKHKNPHKNKLTIDLTSKQTNIQTNRQTGRQACRQASKQTTSQKEN